MAVPVATKIFVNCTRLGAVTVYNKVGQIWQFVLVIIATVHYLHPINLLHVQQPYQCLLKIIVVTSVSPIRYECDCVGLQETFTQKLVASRRHLYRLDKYLYVPYLHEFAPKGSKRLS